MKIVRCAQCGRLVHINNVCFFCGSEREGTAVSEAEVHENAAVQFTLAQTLVAQGRFDEAEKELSVVMKWSATSSEVHWLRLLARSGCRNDRELLFSGIDIAASPDYETALRYASDPEKKVYASVERASATLRSTLVNMIKSRSAKMTDDMQLEQRLSGMHQFLQEKTAALLNAWQELRKCEQEMKLLESEGLIYVHECRCSMQTVRDKASQLRGSLENTDEIERRQFFLYKTKLESMKMTAESAKEEYYRLKSQHPSVAGFAELRQKRDGIKAQIDSGLAQVKQYEREIEALITEVNSKNRDSSTLLELAEAGSYGQVKSVLGQANFDRAVRYALSK
ncbi:MAG: tetratricopeptide repeat protein [Oscillospiraceae bacterium]